MSDVVVEVPSNTGQVVEVVVQAPEVIEIPVGPRGLAGPPPSTEDVETIVTAYLVENPVSSGVEYAQPSPLASWVIPHGFGRVPSVTVYVGGEIVDTDIAATGSVVTITFPSPTAGVAVLN